MRKLRVLSCKFGVAALAALLSASASAATLARQSGAFGIVTCDSIPVPPETPTGILARQSGAFGIITYDPLPVTETQTTPVPVPYAWLDAHVPGIAYACEAYEAAAKKTAANGRLSVVDCYVVGLDPESTTNDFKITSFPMKADGTPDLANLEFAPAQSEWNVPGARAVVKGAATLNGEWKAVEEATAAEKAAMRFFKVVVEVQ